MEWPAAFGNSKRAGKSLAWALLGGLLALGSLGIGIWIACSFPTLNSYPLVICAGFAVGLGLLTAKAARRAILLAEDTGSARLVLHHDSLIWVPGGGAIPQVYRKSEITAVAPIPTLKPRRVGLVLEEAPHPRFHVVLKGRFAPRDLAWLAEVLGKWFATAP